MTCQVHLIAYSVAAVPVRDVEAVLGGEAVLPCDILPDDSHDDVYLVLWFKDDATKPMYRYIKALVNVMSEKKVLKSTDL